MFKINVWRHFSIKCFFAFKASASLTIFDVNVKFTNILPLTDFILL